MTSAVLFTNVRILTLAQAPKIGANTKGPRRGHTMRDLGVIERGYVYTVDGRIAAVGAGDPPAEITAARCDYDGCVLMPAFVDCHTHACWGGNRYGEVSERLAGVPYLDILARGGGIMSTVRATREACASDPLGEGLLRILSKRTD